ncbi:MAG: L-aspartate oxidase, partial [Candidatus Margulisiibacteriota bacterium]
MEIFKSDFLIVGGGISGLTASLVCAQKGSVTLLTKGKTEETATEKAQGGIAVALDSVNDSTSYHLEDTLEAGAGLCDRQAVEVLVKDGVERVKELIEMGADFDRTLSGFELNIEGAHRKRRILHAGDYTGKEIARTLAARVIKNKNIKIRNFIFGKDLIIKDGRCIGVFAFDSVKGKKTAFLAPAVIISTGGICQIYKYTTNPEFATGDGMAMAYRAGAVLRDMEFVQFHPTALVQFKGLDEEIAFPQFLISEAVRGEGALLLNKNGERFMEKYHAQAELAPRDIVSRAIFGEMKKTDSDHVHLNLSGIDPEKIKKRFPTIYKTCKEVGLDLTCDDIPVAPAAHYFMGGIKTDLEGRTNIPGLWAAGEAMSSGVHGANRLASNSLLEGVVFGRRAAESACGYLKALTPNPSPIGRGAVMALNRVKVLSKSVKAQDISKLKNFIKRLMWEHVGIIRSEISLNQAMIELEKLSAKLDFEPENKDEAELINMVLVGSLVTKAALDRTESRGAHYRTDFPKRNDSEW